MPSGSLRAALSIVVLLGASAAQADDAAPEARSIWERRILEDAERETFTLTGARPSYLLYTVQSTPNREPYRFVGSAEQLSQREVKLQLSLQTKVASSLFGDNGDLWAAYTQVAYWQAPNDAISSPFRESNHEPELFLSFLTDYRLLGWTGRSVSVGVVHQSNGQSEPLSRSWNRVYADFQFLRGPFAIGLRPWIRIREDPGEDDNPDIDDYLGHYEIRASWELDRHLFSLMARNVFRRYNLELNWSFHIAGRLRGLVQLTSGHGENLIDYNHKNHRIGIGILMSDWL